VRLYLQTRLEGMGYRAAFGGGSWPQPFDIVGIKSQFPKSWSFQARGQRVDLAWRDDYIAASGPAEQRASRSRMPSWCSSVRLQAPEYQWTTSRAVDVAGRTLVMMNNDPDWDPNLFAGKRRLYTAAGTTSTRARARHRAPARSSFHNQHLGGFIPGMVVQSFLGR